MNFVSTDQSQQVSAMLITALMRVQEHPGLLPEDVKRAGFLSARLLAAFHPLEPVTGKLAVA